MSKIESVRKLNAREIELGIAGTSASWHAQYANSSVVHVGGIQSSATSESLLGIFEQYGKVEHLHIPTNEKTQESRGFAFIGYADARSAVLAVDNLNGFDVDGRHISVDHVADYTYPLDERGKCTKHNARVDKKDGARTVPMTADEKWVSEEGGLKEREEKIMERLRAMQRKKVVTTHSDDEGASKKRSRSSLIEERNGDRRKQVRRSERREEENGVRERAEIPGEKEKRRLERAAIREERRRRRAKRLERRAARGDSGTEAYSRRI